MSEILDVLTSALMVSTFVFVMMLIVDYINVWSRGKMGTAIRGGRWRQYTMASFLGATPGCLGAFMNVSFYIRGLLSFGAMVGGMIATSGDEAFVMLALFPRITLLLVALLFVLGILFAWLADKIAAALKIVPCQECELAPVHIEDEDCRCFEPRVLRNFPRISLQRAALISLLVLFIVAIGIGLLGPVAWNWQRIALFSLLLVTLAIISTVPEHFLRAHIWEHIVKRHLWRVFLWTFFALLFVNIGFSYWNLEAFVKAHMGLVLLLGALIGIVPESGPHMIFVIMFNAGLVPFSVLFTSSFVQDGHGMLPLLSYTIKDSILIKLFNLIFGLALGLILYLVGW